jgi:hypothetical protein
MEPISRKNWFDRNWKWFVPLACLWGLAVAAGFCALIVYFAFGLMKTSDVYKEALARAKANPAVVRALGAPIEEGLFVSGSIQVSGPSGDADLAIPLSGSKGKGTIFLEARKSAGRWSFSKLLVEVDDTKERIDLLRPGEAPLPSESAPGKGSDIAI